MTHHPELPDESSAQPILTALRHTPPSSYTALKVILETVHDMYHLDVGLIYIADYVKEELVCLANHGCDMVNQPTERLRYKFTDTSLATKVFKSRKGYCSPEPWTDPVVSQVGVQTLGIHTSIVGMPLTFDGRVLGVMVIWRRKPPGPTSAHIKQLRPLARLAASLLDTVLAEERRTSILQGLSGVMKHAQVEVGKQRALTVIMEALQAFPFDRVRLFEYHQRLQCFVLVDCLGMTADKLLQTKISTETNPYAHHTLRTYATNPKARIYTGQFGNDPDAELLQKSDDLPWAVVPLILNEDLIGQIVVDNAKTRQPITDDGKDYLDAMSALAVAAIANRRSIQFLSLDSLPVLFSALAADTDRGNTIKRLLIYLTSPEAMGFSRAIFLEWRDRPERLVYRTGIGPVTEEDYKQAPEVTASVSLEDALRTVPRMVDPQPLDDRLKTFEIVLAQPGARELVQHNAPGTHSEASGPAPWFSDMARRIGDSAVLTMPVRIDERILGLFIVDRRWQKQPLGTVHTLALRTFAQLASRVLEQNEIYQRNARQQSDREWEGIVKVAAHGCRDPVAAIGRVLLMAESAVERNDQRRVLDELSVLRTHVGRIRRFIEKFLSLSPSAETTPIDLALLLKEACGLEELREAGVVPRLVCQQGIRIVGDREPLLTGFRQLLENALHWLDKEPKLIEIEADLLPVTFTPPSLDGAVLYAVVRVRDNGKGVDPNDVERIFEPGFTRRRAQGGTGFGLFMVKKIVEAQGGLIDYYGYPGAGATFSVFLPLCREPAASPATAQKESGTTKKA